MSSDERPDAPLVIKCGYENTTRRVTFPSATACRLDAVRARVQECFHLSALGFALTYIDDNGEDFVVRSEDDLTEAIDYFASGGDEAGGSNITLRLEVVVEYDGPSLSDTSSLRSFESGTGLESGSGDWSSSYYTHSRSTEQEDDRLTVSGSARSVHESARSPSELGHSELGSRWLREQEDIRRRGARGKIRRRGSDEDSLSDALGDLNLIRDARGKYYYSYGSEISDDEVVNLPARPDIPVTGLAIEPGAPPILAPDCSACGIRLDYMRYVCTTCGEGQMWKEGASRPAQQAAPSDMSESTDSTEDGTVYVRPRSESIVSMEAVKGISLEPARKPGYELCPTCIEEHGIAHARGAASRSSRRLRHAFREKIWGLEGWTDIEYNEDIDCTICRSRLTKHRFRCVSCPKFDMCRACYQRVGEIHPAHAFLSLPEKVDQPPEPHHAISEVPPMRHPGAFCHNCLQDIVGPRFHCAVCPSWDLCIQCEGISAASGGHTSDHIMMKIPVPIAAAQVEAVSRRARERWLEDSVASPRSASPTNETVYGEPTSRLDSLDHRCRCKGCNEWILGKRFQCANCPSEPDTFSLCSVCELRSYRLHNPLHVFLKFDRPVHIPLASPHPILPLLLRNRVGDVPPGVTPRDPSAYLQYVLHRETLCDIHSDQIRGVWLRCAHCPAGFDICAEAEAIAEHDPTHVFIVFKARVDMAKFRELAQLGGDRPRALLQSQVYTR